MKAKDLKQDKKNYRKHSDENKKRIKKSIDECGLGRSVLVDADGVLIAGNGVQSVIDGETKVKVVETDGTELVVVKRTDLHEGDERRRKLALADNAASDNVEWDMEAIEADGWDAEALGEWGVVEMKDEGEKLNMDEFFAPNEDQQQKKNETLTVEIPESLADKKPDIKAIIEQTLVDYEGIKVK